MATKPCLLGCCRQQAHLLLLGGALVSWWHCLCVVPTARDSCALVPALCLQTVFHTDTSLFSSSPFFPLCYTPWQKTAHKYRGEDGESSNTVRFGDTYKCISAQEQLYYIHCRVVRFSIWKIETQPTNLYNKHQSVQSSQDSTPRNQTDSIQYAMALFFPQKNYRAMNSTYTIYAGECPGRPQSTVHRSNLICPEVQPLTRWNIATIQNENITQVLVRFSFTGRNTFVGRVHRFVQMGIELGDRHQHLTIMMNAAIVLVTGVNRLHYKCQSNSQECGSSTFWQHWFHIWSNGDQWVSGFKAADSLKPPSSWSVSNQTG